MNKDSYGVVTVFHKGKKITTSVGSNSYDSFTNSIINTGTKGRIPAGYAHRPDLISDLFTNTPASWWAICEANSIFDIFEELNAGDSIKLP